MAGPCAIFRTYNQAGSKVIRLHSLATCPISWPPSKAVPNFNSEWLKFDLVANYKSRPADQPCTLEATRRPSITPSRMTSTFAWRLLKSTKERWCWAINYKGATPLHTWQVWNASTSKLQILTMVDRHVMIVQYRSGKKWVMRRINSSKTTRVRTSNRLLGF